MEIFLGAKFSSQEGLEVNFLVDGERHIPRDGDSILRLLARLPEGQRRVGSAQGPVHDGSAQPLATWTPWVSSGLLGWVLPLPLGN